MNEYRYNDLKIGMTESFYHVITEHEMDLFCEISGDTNPLHTNPSFAKEHGFTNRVVYGMLSASLISKMGGVSFAGKILSDSTGGKQVCCSSFYRR
jgi:3-hydroxybutyryl-CoA dehydratase